MKEEPKPQIITQNGEPVFAVIPWEEYQQLTRRGEETTSPKTAVNENWYPKEVIQAHVAGASLLRSWRKYLGMTQAMLSEKANVSQPSLVRLENRVGKPRKSTMEKLADAMGLSVAQLLE